MENPSGRVRLAGIDVLKDLDLLRTDVFPGGADVTVPDRSLRGLRTLYQKIDVPVVGRVCTWPETQSSDGMGKDSEESDFGPEDTEVVVLRVHEIKGIDFVPVPL